MCNQIVIVPRRFIPFARSGAIGLARQTLSAFHYRVKQRLGRKGRHGEMKMKMKKVLNRLVPYVGLIEGDAGCTENVVRGTPRISLFISRSPTAGWYFKVHCKMP